MGIGLADGLRKTAVRLTLFLSWNLLRLPCFCQMAANPVAFEVGAAACFSGGSR
jgi:hypothetical protein